jgi:hypothetical protein
MNTTPGWILVVTLTQGLQVDLGPQPDCTYVGAVWIRQAKHWAARSGIPTTDPFYSCTPPAITYQVERVSR